jgi:hypothetical protein
MKFKEWFLQEYTKDKSRRLQLSKKVKKQDWAARPEIYEAWQMPRWVNTQHPDPVEVEEGWELVGSSSNRGRTVQAKPDGTIRAVYYKSGTPQIQNVPTKVENAEQLLNIIDMFEQMPVNVHHWSRFFGWPDHQIPNPEYIARVNQWWLDKANAGRRTNDENLSGKDIDQWLADNAKKPKPDNL